MDKRHRRHRRYKLLLDENLPAKQLFPKLNELHNVVHVKLDFKQEGLDDLAVFGLAKKDKRLIVTFNEKDFRNFAKVSKDTGIIGVSTNLEVKQIDKKLVALLRRKTRGKLYGNFNRLIGEK